MKTSLQKCYPCEQMNSTKYRDETANLAKVNQAKAIATAERIKDPWFRAQAWAHIARHADKPLIYARKAAKSAAETKDDYQRSAVRAWEVAALAERGFYEQARKALNEAVSLAIAVRQEGSKAEALLLLFQAAFKVNAVEARRIATVMSDNVSVSHWRGQRALKRVSAMLDGREQSREFFW